MITLLIDTHFNILLALFKDDKLLSKKEIINERDLGTVCIPSLVDLLKDNELDIHDLNDIIVCIGPGSFTGERLGVTIAKTLAYTLNIPIRTVTSLEMYYKDGYDYIVMAEKNGYYVGIIKNNNIVDYQYLNKDEINNLKGNVLYTHELVDLDGIVKKTHLKDSLNPHIVNPFYVKKIEVEK